MVGKRKKSEGEALAEEEQPQLKKRQLLPSLIKNKEKRSAVHAKLKREKKLEKRKKTKARDAAEKRALELGEEPPLKKVPRTIENTRESDETVCMPDDEELFAANDVDEFSAILKRERTPKILITTCRFNSTRGPTFISELLSVIPNAHYYKRGTYDLKKIVDYAKNDDFTSLIVVHTNRREPDALLIIGLPDGPTAHFKLSKLVLRKDIKVCKHQFFFSCSCISSLVNQATRCIKCFYLQ
ncbi:ribosome production factor 1-like isoform X2 [Macadamia integrifolia]|nr:ribosome production factor 1-like isoform X2 [Macadamia integrifolia]XP_042492584.1 ribosome production factor 1-like isoform X2 [Macadamia integrifolia]